ncbi:GNAT family N-acetyltransferase [Nonlabens antarcticus]|uniref:GNAT family N-acetyltransferase n=1 Tax=Nonlabens antarcticus TaxID=392714 RepID=UPI00293BE8B4|nr:GNAT family N-acetyltransferase [Nonlabens antarcticus]
MLRFKLREQIVFLGIKCRKPEITTTVQNTSFPYFETERLILNELSTEDIPLIVKNAVNPNISQFTQNIPHPYEESDAIYWINRAHQGFKNGTNHVFAIRWKESGEFMGGIGLTLEKRFNRAEVGYWIAEPFWNKGIMTEATKRIIQYGFADLKLNKITSSHLVENPASGKVMRKGGMQKEGILRQQVSKTDRYYDLVVYGILSKEFKMD